MKETFRQRILNEILAADRTQANVLIDEWAQKYGYERTITELLEPILHEIGVLWIDGKNSLAQAYIASKVIEDAMLKAAAEQGAIPQTKKGPVVIGNIEDDYHALGRSLVVTFLRSDGWEVVDLGNDVLAETFVDTALDVGAKVIGVSAMMMTTALNIKKVRTEIDQRGLTHKLHLAVGGAVFIERPELVEEVGGDGTARNALAATELMEELWGKSEADV